MSSALYDNKDKFPQEEQNSISLMRSNTTGLIAITLGFVISILVFGIESKITPGLEWGTVIYLVNFYSIMSFTNPFYESIHLPAKPSSSQDQI